MNLKDKVSNENDFEAHLKNLSEGLYYISETDAEILPFTGMKAESVTKEEVLKQINKPLDTPVEEREFSEIFARLTRIQDWFGEREKTVAEKYSRLKDLLEKNLKDLKVYKVGRINIDIYFVGLDTEGNLKGIQTKAIET